MNNFNLKNKTLLLLLFVNFIFANLLVIFDSLLPSSVNFIFGFTAFLLTPSILLSKLLRNKVNLEKTLSLGVTFVITTAILIFEGFILNLVGHLLGFDSPLTKIPILIFTDVLILILFFLESKNSKHYHLQFDRKSFIELAIFPAILLVALLGITKVNNGADGDLVIFTIIALVSAWTFLAFRKNTKKFIYWHLYFSSLTILLMWALRSYHLSGGDIAIEYAVFRHTYDSGSWGSIIVDIAYDACLSITILPTLLSHLLGINGEYIYKLVFPILYAFSPLFLYKYVAKLFSDKIALLSVIIFTAQSTFIFWMPMLARQEMGFLFFSCAVLILLLGDVATIKTRKTLFSLLCVALIASHYTTSYIAIGIFTGMYIAQLLFARKTIFKNDITKVLSGRMLFVLVLAAFLWQGQINNNTSGVSKFFTKTLNNITSSTSGDFKNPAATKALSLNAFSGSNDKVAQKKILQQYIAEFNLKNKSGGEYYYQQALQDKYQSKINITSSQGIKPQNGFLSQIINIVILILGVLMRLVLFIGVIILFIKTLKDRSLAPYTAASILFAGLIGCFVLLPFISTAYNIERLYQQALYFLAPAVVIGILFILKPLKKLAMPLTIFTLFVYFFYTTRLLSQIGGGDASPLFNNFGMQYDTIYTHSSEVSAIDWLEANRNKKKVVVAEDISSRQLNAYGDISIVQTDMLPQSIPKKSYVYLSRTNYIENINLRYYKGKLLYYTTPIDFLEDNKNTVYSSGDSIILE